MKSVMNAIVETQIENKNSLICDEEKRINSVRNGRKKKKSTE